MKKQLYLKRSILLRIPLIRILALCVIFLFITLQTFAQITGKVTDENGEALIGASVVLKNTTKGTITNADGSFSLDVEEGAMLVFSYTGFIKKELAATKKMTVQLVSDSKALDEIIVTGVFDARSSMESSIAISTLDSKKMDKLVATSSADLFTNTPGVYVNSSAGETRNQVYTRGISVGSSYSLTSAANGYFYLSLQEDGLPVTAISDATFVSDLFFRADASVRRLESVRGGSSSITSVNAPGGIFNFLSKNGTEESKEVRARFGLEGDGRYFFFRTDLNYGGKINENLIYNVGGFYRRAQGARYAGYPLNNGGQIKANLTKLYKQGSIRFFAKYLNDINGTTMVQPAVGFDDIELAPGVNFSDSYLFTEGEVEIPDGRGGFTTFDPTIPQRSKDFSIGFNLTHDLSDSWTIKNDFKYSIKDYAANANAATSFTSLTDATTYFFMGIFGPPGSANVPGTVTFTNRETNQTVATVDFAPPFGGPPSFDITSSNLPEAVSNSLLYGGSRLQRGDLSEVMNQFSISKKWENAGINAGVFYSNSQANSFEQTSAVLSLNLIQDRPVPLDISYQGVNGMTYQLTDPNSGYLKLGGSFGYGDLDYSVNQLAFFFGNNFSLFQNKLNIDWGLRFETSSVKGTNDTLPMVPEV